jgi:predicted phosphodiesterase
MEPLWSPVDATGGNQWQMARPRRPLEQAKTVAVGCDRLHESFHGKEGVDGSSPSEGSAKAPQNGAAATRSTFFFCHDPRTLEQGTHARGPFAALAAKLRPALVIYGHQHRPHVSADGQPALVGLGSFRDGQSSAMVLDSDETGRLVRALRRRPATQPGAA